MYEKVNNILKKQGRGTSNSNIDYCFETYLNKLYENDIPIDNLYKAVKNFLAEKITKTNHPIPMFHSLLDNFATGKYDFNSYLNMNDKELHKKAREYLARLVNGKNGKKEKKLSGADAAGLGSLL